MANIPVIPGVSVATKGILNKPLKDIICAILFGGINNMLKGPLICVNLDIDKLLSENIDGFPSLTDLKNELADLKDQLKAAEALSGIPETLARVNAAIAEVQSLLALDGLCKIPLKAPKIPDVVAEVIDAEFREMNAILNDLGRLAKPSMCLDAGGGMSLGKGYNPDSILGSIQKHGGKMADIPGDKINALKKRLQGVTKALKKSINRQLFPDFRHKHDLITGRPYTPGGGPTVASAPPLANQWNPPYPPPEAQNLKSATATAQTLVASLKQTASYPVKADGIENANIWLPLLGPEVYSLAVTALTPQDPFFAQEEPIYDYCGKLVGYTSTVVSGDANDMGGNPTEDAVLDPVPTAFEFLWIADREGKPIWAVSGNDSEQTVNGRKGVYLNENPMVELHRGYNHTFSIPSRDVHVPIKTEKFQITKQDYDEKWEKTHWRDHIKDTSNDPTSPTYEIDRITDDSLAPEFYICYVDENLQPRKVNGKLDLFVQGIARLETNELAAEANGQNKFDEQRKVYYPSEEDIDVSSPNNKSYAYTRKESSILAGAMSTTMYFAAEQRVYSGDTAPANPSEEVWWYNLTSCDTQRFVLTRELNPVTGLMEVVDGTGNWIPVLDSDRTKAWFGSSNTFGDPHVDYLAYSNQAGTVFGLFKFI